MNGRKKGTGWEARTWYRRKRKGKEQGTEKGRKRKGRGPRVYRFTGDPGPTNTRGHQRSPALGLATKSSVHSSELRLAPCAYGSDLMERELEIRSSSHRPESGKSTVTELGRKTAWFARSSATPNAHCVQAHLKADAAFRETLSATDAFGHPSSGKEVGKPPTLLPKSGPNFYPKHQHERDFNKTVLSCHSFRQLWQLLANCAKFPELAEVAMNRPGKGNYFPKPLPENDRFFALPVRQNLTLLFWNRLRRMFLDR